MAARFSQEVVDRLLEKLATDDDFRELFQKDAREALRQVGHETPKEFVGVAAQDPVMCCQVQTLAGKEQFKVSRDKLSARLMIHDPFAYFEA